MIPYIRERISILLDLTVVRYVISGGTSATADLILLYLLHDVFDVHYLFAQALAFLGAFAVSFYLQKFWTFRNTERVDVHKQAGLYLMTSLVGLSFNTLLLYVFVDHAHLNVIVAQICAGGIVACFTFFLSRNIVFKVKNNPQHNHEDEASRVYSEDR